MFVNRLAIVVLLLTGFSFGLPVGAKVMTIDGASDPSVFYPMGDIIFDVEPDPSAVYPASWRIPKDGETDRECESSLSETQSDLSKIDKSSPAWKTWYAAIDKALAERFTSVSGMFSYGPALRAMIRYSVTKDKQITDVRVDQKSPNLMFNIAVQGVVNSLNNDPLLQLPDGNDGRDLQMRAEFKTDGKYEGWHDERDRVIQRIGDFQYRF